ncbi:SIS domain-containing protein [bacterium]|nr:SIS domain-containing protein [bacterium]
MQKTYIENYLSKAQQLLGDIQPGTLVRMAEIVAHAWRQNNTVFIIGNGGSASTATHLACDLSKCTICGETRRLKAMSLVDNIPLTSAWTNDNGFASVFEEQLKNWMDDGDVLIAFSVHGGSGQGEAGEWSQNIPRAVNYTKSRKGRVLGFSGFGGGYLAIAADECVVINIDSEPLGTPLVESLHSLLAHLLTQCVRQEIARNMEAPA